MKNNFNNLPPEIKNFWRLFEKVAYRHQYSGVFDDFLTMSINYFANGHYIKQRDETMAKYSKSEKQLFNEMFNCLILSLKEIFNRFEWFDFFGTVYESIILSKGKQSGLAQFFTPPGIVDMLVMFNLSGKEENKTVYDPACGSGRMLIASHVYSPKNYVFGADIDIICCKMTVLNMFFHGCRGEVVHMDSLRADFFQAWAVDIHPLFKLPYIYEVKKENSFIMARFDEMANRRETRILKEKQQQAEPEPQQQKINFDVNIKENAFFESLF